MTVLIPYRSNKAGLSALLCMLQPQLKNSDAIYVVDNSIDKSGAMITQMYGSSRLPIVIELNSPTIYTSWNAGIDFMLENNDDSVLILNDDIVISETLCNNLKRAFSSDYLALVPTTPNRAFSGRRLDANFTWFNKHTEPKDIVQTKWLCGFVFCLKREAIEAVGKFDERYKVWFGDTEFEERLKGKIGRLTNEYVFHFGGSSFDYKDEKVLEIIAKDRSVYQNRTKKRSAR